MITQQVIDDFQNDGVVVLRNLFADWIPRLSLGADFNAEKPSHRALIHSTQGANGKFLEDFCSWERIPQYKDFIFSSPLGSVAAQLMQSQSVQFFHDHYLHKEAQSGVATPWHQDSPYYFVQGRQTVSFWIPLEHRAKEVSLKCAAGSHLLPKEIRPTSWSTLESFYDNNSDFMELPDIETGDFVVKEWALEPGDAVAFNFRIIHAANPNTVNAINRTLSFRLVGDDVRYCQRPGRTSPSFPDIDLQDGDRLREDWFPLIWPL